MSAVQTQLTVAAYTDIMSPVSWLVTVIGLFGLANAGAERQCPGVEFVTREEWNSSKPNKQPDLLHAVNMTFIHHTAGGECDNQAKCSSIMRGIQRFHIDDRKWDDIGYSFLIGGDGKVYIGRDWQRVGAHTLNYNSVAYGISFMGNFMDHVPNDKMIQAAKALIKCGVDQDYILEDYSLYGHRDGRCTECPGDAFYKTLGSWGKNWHAFGPIKVYC